MTRRGEGSSAPAAAIDALPHPYQDLSATGEILRVNDAWVETLGYDRSTVRGTPFDSLLVPDSRQPFEDWRLALESEGSAADVELQIRTADDTPIWISLAGQIQPEERPGRIRGQFREITEQRRRESRLRRFKHAAEAAGHAVYITDPEGVIEYVNPEFERITGYTSADAVGQTPRILKSGVMDADYYAALWERIRAGEIWEEEVTNRRKDGELYDASQTIAPVVDDGEIEAYIAIQEEITDRKERQRDLEVFQELIDAANDNVFIVDGETGTIRYANQTVCESLGYDCEELLGMSPAAISTEFESPEAHREFIQDASVPSMETEHVRKDGTTVSVEVSGNVVHVDGQTYRIIIARDISDRKRRIAELEARKNRLELALEGAVLSVWDWDMETGVLDRDDQWAHQLGYEPGEIESSLQGCERLIHPEDRTRHREALAAHVHGEAEYYQCEYRLKTKSGEWKWIRNVGKILDRDADGDPRRAVGIHQDIDEQKRTREALERNTELLTVIDRVLRHNLHNDMNVIQGFAGQIREEADGRLVGYADRVLATSQQLLETANKERDIVEFLADSHEVKPLDVASLARGMQSLGATYPEATVSVTAPGTCLAMASDSLERALHELVENAIVHSDRPHPAVSIAVEPGAETVKIKVIDGGPGIPKMEREILTGEAEIQPLYHGSGLGLWLVNLVVARSDGELRFDANEPRGSIVTVELPAAEPGDDRSGTDGQ